MCFFQNKKKCNYFILAVLMWQVWHFSEKWRCCCSQVHGSLQQFHHVASNNNVTFEKDIILVTSKLSRWNKVVFSCESINVMHSSDSFVRDQLWYVWQLVILSNTHIVKYTCMTFLKIPNYAISHKPDKWGENTFST